MGTRPREAWRPDVAVAEAASHLPPAYRTLTGGEVEWTHTGKKKEALPFRPHPHPLHHSVIAFGG